MKKLIIIFFCSCFLIPGNTVASTIRLSGTTGIYSDISSIILIEAYQQIGYEILIDILPPERGIQLSNLGKYDGEVHRIKEIELQYPNLVRIPVSVNYLEAVVFTKNADFEVKSWRSLEPYSIIIRRGIKFLEYNTKGMDVSLFDSTEKLFELIEYDRYDIALETKLTGLSVLKKSGFKKIKMLSRPLTKIHLYHYLHKKHMNLLPKIENTLKKMDESGRLQEIRNEFVRRLLNDNG